MSTATFIGFRREGELYEIILRGNNMVFGRSAAHLDTQPFEYLYTMTEDRRTLYEQLRLSMAQGYKKCIVKWSASGSKYTDSIANVLQEVLWCRNSPEYQIYITLDIDHTKLINTIDPAFSYFTLKATSKDGFNTIDFEVP